MSLGYNLYTADISLDRLRAAAPDLAREVEEVRDLIGELFERYRTFEGLADALERQAKEKR